MLLFLALLSAVAVRSQEIAGYEYWIDDNFEGRTVVTGNSSDINLDIEFVELFRRIDPKIVEEDEINPNNVLAEYNELTGENIEDISYLVSKYENAKSIYHILYHNVYSLECNYVSS